MKITERYSVTVFGDSKTIVSIVMMVVLKIKVTGIGTDKIHYQSIIMFEAKEAINKKKEEEEEASCSINTELR